MRQAKQVYKDQYPPYFDSIETYIPRYSQLQTLKSEVEFMERSVERSREKMLQEFDSWYMDTYDHSKSTHLHISSNDQRETANDDILDYQEKFDKMAFERIVQEDPESGSFYAARKNIFGSSKKKVNLPSISKSKGRRSPFK